MKEILEAWREYQTKLLQEQVDRVRGYTDAMQRRAPRRGKVEKTQRITSTEPVVGRQTIDQKLPASVRAHYKQIADADEWRQAQYKKYGKNLIGAPDSVMSDPRWVSPGELPYGKEPPPRPSAPTKTRPGKPSKPRTGTPQTSLSSMSPTGRVIDYPAPVIDPLTGKAVPPPDFKEPYPDSIASRKKRTKRVPGLAAGGTALGAVDAIDAMAGPELRKLVAKMTGKSTANIADATLQDRLKRLATPYTDLASFVAQAGGKVARAITDTRTSEEEAEAAYARRIGDEDAARRAAERSGYKVNPKGFIPGQRAGATIASPIREDKVRGEIEETSGGNNTGIRIKIRL